MVALFFWYLNVFDVGLSERRPQKELTYSERELAKEEIERGT